MQNIDEFFNLVGSYDSCYDPPDSRSTPLNCAIYNTSLNGALCFDLD